MLGILHGGAQKGGLANKSQSKGLADVESAHTSHRGGEQNRGLDWSTALLVFGSYMNIQEEGENKIPKVRPGKLPLQRNNPVP